MTHCKPLSSCPAEIPQVPTVYPAFTACIGGGRSIIWDGKGARLSGTNNIPNGTYTQFTITDGCIVAAGDAPLPEYTPPPCAPQVPSCAGGGGQTAVSPAAGNLIQSTGLGLYAKLSFGAGNVVVTGAGTPEDPYILNTQGASSITSVSGAAGISATQVGAGVIMTMDNVMTAGTYAGFAVNARGQITSYTAPASSGVLSIVDGSGEIEVTNTAGTYSVGIKETAAGASTLEFGGAKVTTTPGGCIKTFEATETYTGDVKYVDNSTGTPVNRVMTFNKGVLTKVV